MEYREYLVGYGKTGAFGRFRPCYPVRCVRGDSVVVRTDEGLELGTVLCEATAGHARFLPNTTVGEFVRVVTARDAHVAACLELRAQELFGDARRLVAELALPLEVLDADVLLDGKLARVHYLGSATCDPRPLLETLADRHHLLIRLHNLAEVDEASREDEHETCGSCGSCGSCSAGGCGSCAVAVPGSEAIAPSRVALL